MEKLNLVCIDDQAEVLAAVRRDLGELSEKCRVSECESAEEAQELLEELYNEGAPIAVLICDQVMPGTSGVEFLTAVAKDGRFSHTQKLLLTGLATHEDTITAINQAGIDQYVEKPWEREPFLRAVRVLITNYVLTAGFDYQQYLSVLDQETLYQGLRSRS